ncbi:hypothetical protein ACVWW1_004632 [Bradyrhizobium sp. JR3.5]
MLIEPANQLGGDESLRHVAPNDLRSLLRELRQEVGRPRPVAEQRSDSLALGVVFVLGDQLALERIAVEIATEHEGAILLDLVPVKAKEGMLGF